MDPGDAPEELFALVAVFAGFALLVASVGVAARRYGEAVESSRIEAAAGALLEAVLGDSRLSDGECLRARALNETASLDRLSPSRTYEVTVEDVVTGLRWAFGPGTRGDYRLALGATCLSHGRGLVAAARVAVAVGS